MMPARGITPKRVSCWYKTDPVPASDQPQFANGVAQIETKLGPHELLLELQAIEAFFGRARRERNEARAMDLDLIAYNDLVLNDNGLELPHPRMAHRGFVIVPLAEIAPNWKHPQSGITAQKMLNSLPGLSGIELWD